MCGLAAGHQAGQRHDVLPSLRCPPSSCRRLPPSPAAPLPPRRLPPAAPGPPPLAPVLLVLQRQSTCLSMPMSPAPPQRWPTAPQTPPLRWQRPPGQHPLVQPPTRHFYMLPPAINCSWTAALGWNDLPPAPVSTPVNAPPCFPPSAAGQRQPSLWTAPAAPPLRPPAACVRPPSRPPPTSSPAGVLPCAGGWAGGVETDACCCFVVSGVWLPASGRAPVENPAQLAHTGSQTTLMLAVAPTAGWSARSRAPRGRWRRWLMPSRALPATSSESLAWVLGGCCCCCCHLRCRCLCPASAAVWPCCCRCRCCAGRVAPRLVALEESEVSRCRRPCRCAAGSMCCLAPARPPGPPAAAPQQRQRRGSRCL